MTHAFKIQGGSFVLTPNGELSMSKASLKVIESPERAELAAAITQHRALSERLAAAVAAGDWTKKVALKENVERAKAAFEKSKTDSAKHLTNRMLGEREDAEDAPISIQDARAALAAAQDELEIWEMSSKSLQVEVKRLREDVTTAKNEVETAIIRLVEGSPEAHAVFEAYNQLQRQLAGHRKIMSALSLYAPLGWDVIHNPDDAEDTSATIAAWQASIAALQTDASAPLPLSGGMR